MLKTIQVTTPNAEILTMELTSPEKSGFVIQSLEGLGPPKSNVNLSPSLYHDGAYFNSARNDTRNLVLNLEFMDSPSETIEDLRLKTYRYFPTKTPLTIRITTERRSAITTAYVESNEPNIFSKEESTQISLICPDSYFYDTQPVITTFTGVSGGFEFPFENMSLVSPTLTFGDVYINTKANVFYTGDVPTGLTIFVTFLGAVNNLVISNTVTGENMSISSTKLIALTGYDFKAGDKLIISTVAGSKFIYLVRDGAWINILNTISAIADWFTIQKGDNVFTYTVGSGLSNVQFLIQHQVVYEGL